MPDTTAKTSRPTIATRDIAATTTPFPAIAGSSVEKTEDRYYCRACLCVDYADHNEVTGAIYCAECDSEDVSPLEQKRREDRAQREAFLAESDREADARYSSLAVLL